MGQTTDLGGSDEQPTTRPSRPTTRAELRRAAETRGTAETRETAEDHTLAWAPVAAGAESPPLADVRLEEPPAAPAPHASGRSWLWSLTVAVVAWGVTMPSELDTPIGALLAPGIALTFLVAIVDRENLRGRGRPGAPWAVLAFLAFCAASVTWSVDPQDTVSMTALYAVIAALAVLLVWWTDARTFLRGLVLALVAVAGTTLWAVAIDRPQAIVTTFEVGAAYTGLYGNRNVLAYTIILLVPALLALGFRIRYVALPIKALCLAGVVALIYLTRSSTGKAAIVVLLAAAVAVWTLRFVRPRARVVLASVSLAVAGLGASAALLNRASLAAAFNKDATFSGRTLLWKKILAVTEDRPIGGYGWGTVWRYYWYGQDGSAAYNRITRRLEKGYVHGHNGVFDVLPQVGFVGTALILAIVVVALVRTLRALVTVPAGAATTAASEATVFAALALVALAVLAPTEPALTIPLGWFVLVALATSAGRATRPRTRLALSAPSRRGRPARPGAS